MYNLLAYLKHLNGDHEKALLQLQKAEAQRQESGTSEDTDVKRTVMYGNFAWVFYYLNQFIKGFTYAEKVETILKKYESSPMQKTLLLDIYGEQGWTYLSFTGKYYQQAVECFEKALELDQEDPELNSGYAMALYRTEGFTLNSNPANKSFQLLERAVTLNPRDTVAKALLALKYQDIGKFNYCKGTMLIEQALQEEPESPYVLRYVATFYKNKRQVEKAIEILKKAESLTPNSCAIHLQLAKCYKKLIRWPKTLEHNSDPISNALYHSEKAVELNKLSVAAHILLATVYVKANKYKKAEEEFETTLTINNITCEQKQELHLSWAHYLLHSKKSNFEAIMHFKEAIKLQVHTCFWETAVQDLKKLAETMIDRNPMDATGYGLLGFIYQQTEQDLEALNYYEKALLLNPDNEEYLDACSTLQSTLP